MGKFVEFVNNVERGSGTNEKRRQCGETDKWTVEGTCSEWGYL